MRRNDCFDQIVPAILICKRAQFFASLGGQAGMAKVLSNFYFQIPTSMFLVSPQIYAIKKVNFQTLKIIFSIF